MEVNLSEIQIVPVKPRSGLLAFASFVLNNAFYVGDIAIYSRLDGEGYRLAYPIKILTNGAKINCFHPINRQSAQAIEEQVIKVYLGFIQKATTRKGVSQDEEFREFS